MKGNKYFLWFRSVDFCGLNYFVFFIKMSVEKGKDEIGEVFFFVNLIRVKLNYVLLILVIVIGDLVRFMLNVFKLY